MSGLVGLAVHALLEVELVALAVDRDECSGVVGIAPVQTMRDDLGSVWRCVYLLPLREDDRRA